MDNAIAPGCSEMCDGEIDDYVDGAGIINDDGPEWGAEGKVDIVVREKQININNEIYYVMYSSKNKTPTMPDKTNKTLIHISF